jgi:hypothetical protein
MQIVSLGKCLDNRRPIDHNKIMDKIEGWVSDPPLRFGIKEFNRCAAEIQLSKAATTQLYILAARGIEEAHQTLARELDSGFRQREGRMRENILIIGACLRRLGLEYRQRLEQLRRFPPSKPPIHAYNRTSLLTNFFRSIR